MQFPRLAQLGWNDELAQQLSAHSDDASTPGRVTVQHRGVWEVATEDAEVDAEITGRLRHAAAPGELPVVGDWVVLRGGLIDGVLPRRSKFSRKMPFTEVAEQVLVANVDVAFLVMALDERDFNVRRLERYLTTAWEGGATPVIVLNKTDLAADLEAQLAEVDAVAFGVPVHAINALAAEGVSAPLDRLDRAAIWLVDRQRDDGTWAPAVIGIYYLSLVYSSDHITTAAGLRALARHRRQRSDRQC